MATPHSSLLTGFEPFGGAKTNISQAVLAGMQAEVTKVILPVSFRNAPLVLQQAIREYHPGILLMLGQCGEEEKIRLERFAFNLMDAPKGDNDGYYPNEETIFPNATTAYRTPYTIRTLVETLVKKGFPVRASNSAGLFVCNRVYYEALHLGQKALFVHIPKTMNVTEATQMIEQIIKYL